MAASCAGDGGDGGGTMDEWVGGTMTIGVVDLDEETTIDEETAVHLC